MSEEEVRRAGVLSRIQEGELSQVEAAEVLGLSYRQVKRIYRRFLSEGAKGLAHRSTLKPSNRARPAKERKRILALVRKHYGGGPGERFGPTLAAEHLQEDHGIVVDRRRCGDGCWAQGYGRKSGSANPIVNGGSGGRTSANWCSWMAALRHGWKTAGRAGV